MFIVSMPGLADPIVKKLQCNIESPSVWKLRILQTCNRPLCPDSFSDNLYIYSFPFVFSFS
jgi:hypothetical protein